MSSEASNEYKFKASTQKLLKIIINSLYKDKEIFFRELISNASDALNKIRIKKLTNEEIRDSDIDLDIQIKVDKENGTITISDTGIGMSKDELIENLGTIAQSGTEEFLKALETAPDKDLIGQFGVGFYSSFLVAKKVEVISKSFKPRTHAYSWTSNGEDSFSVNSAEKETRGTDIILYLNLEDEDIKDFMEDYKIKSIIKQYSNYVEFPIKLGEETLNEQKALWRVNPSEVTDQQYTDFYHHLGQYGDPIAKIHVQVDTPYQFYSILYVPPSRNRMFGINDKEWGLRLYNRKILIEENNKDILPEYLRFIIGVVDAEDLDLNVSREVVQTTRIQRQMNKYLHKKVITEFENLGKDDEEKYLQFFREYGPYLKEGIAAGSELNDRLVDLLRFHSTSEDGKVGSVSLATYVERMKPGQDKIYYLTGLDLDVLKKSPHLEYYEKEGYEVLLLGDAIDNFLMMHIKDYQEKQFFLIDQDESEPETEPETETEDKESEGEEKPKEKTGPFAPILNKAIEILGSKVQDVKTSDRLVNNVARLVTPKGGISSDMQRAMRIMESQTGGANINLPMMGKVLQLNPDHEIIKKLNEMVQNDPDNELIELLINQIHDNARIADGDVPDFTEMLNRSEKIMEKTFK